MSEFSKRLSQIQFNTRVSLAEGSIFDFEKFKTIRELKSTRSFFSLHPIVIIADPFLFSYENELYLFYEEQIDLRGKGKIKMTKTNDLKNWTKPIVVLKEHFHLSYPNVFKVGGSVYMLPETGEDASIRLYKANSDLTEWKLEHILLTGKSFVDTSVFCLKDKYYLFTTDYSNKTNILELYYSDTVKGKWIKHPQSPIAIGKNIGRGAGSLFFYNDVLYRPCQYNEKMYGGGVDIYKIQTLNTTEFKEEKVMKIIPNVVDPFYLLGGHHFNYCEFNGRLIVATDGVEERFNLLEILRRIYNKFSKKS